MSFLRALVPALGLAAAGCTGGGLAEGGRPTPGGTGVPVRWTLEAGPLRGLPLPNDSLTWPDPTAVTGRRLNPSLAVRSGGERELLSALSALDGWGTFAPVEIPFGGPIDTDLLLTSMGRARLAEASFRRHPVYLVDLVTGLPVPLDVNSGRFPRALPQTDAFFANDPRADGSNLLFETVDEASATEDGVYDPAFDDDADGVLDRPNTFDGTLVGAPLETVDRLLTFYERESSTLLLRPLLPLRPGRTYAVVLPHRLRGMDGLPVRSPFPQVHPLDQTAALEGLAPHLAEHPELYGDLAERGWAGIAFAWTFTTQSTAEDLPALRDGLEGLGPFAHLADEVSPELLLAPLRGSSEDPGCAGDAAPYALSPVELAPVLEALGPEPLGLEDGELPGLLDDLTASVSRIALGVFESPYLLGDPAAPSGSDRWDVDRPRGVASRTEDAVPMLLVVPRGTEARGPPFDVALYAHDLGTTALEALAYAAPLAAQGVGTAAITAPGHGLALGDEGRATLRSALRAACLEPLAEALLRDRAADIDADGRPDPGALTLTSHLLRTRDSLRQGALDVVQAIRVLRSLDRPPRSWSPGPLPGAPGSVTFDGDVDGDGAVDRAGDLDGDGVRDMGGREAVYGQWGTGLGALVTALVAEAEPAVRASVPVAGGGGLVDILLRSSLPRVRDPFWMRALGPILASAPSDGPSDRSSCEQGDRSVFFELPGTRSIVRTEVTCVEASLLEDGDAVRVVNITQGTRTCARVGADGRFRLPVPSDEGDRLEVRIWDDGADAMDYAVCAAPPRSLNLRIDRWASECPACGRYRGRRFTAGEPLVAPASGLGLRRQTPGLRRYAGIAQTLLDGGDPITLARRIVLEPGEAPDVPPGPRGLWVVHPVGDTTFPIAAGDALARAAGVLAFLPPDGPTAYADWRAPGRFRDARGVASPDDLLIDLHVIEGLARLARHPVPGAETFLVDVDDLSDGQQLFSPDGRSQRSRDDGGLRPQRPAEPLRWARESRPVAGPDDDPWTGAGGADGHSAVTHPMVLPIGAHRIPTPSPERPFDDGAYLLQAIGWFLASGGSELPWAVLDDASCLAIRSCGFGDGP
ncbi:MAG: hypothetical protein ACFCGT_09645 [Sandaracinaceae bacterium]